MLNSPMLIFRNPVLIPMLCAYLSAQIIKVLLTYILSRKLDFKRLVGAGGMPSSHSAVVVCLSVSVGMRHGWDSTLFAICVAFALVVMYDAQGVRMAAGRQAAAINRIMDWVVESGHKPLAQRPLGELLGHTLLEILAGALLGALIAVLFGVRSTGVA